MAGRNRIPNTLSIEPGASLVRLLSGSRARVQRNRVSAAARAYVFALLLCLGIAHGWAQQDDQQQMRGLDEQVQEVKSDVLSISEELSRLEENLL